MSKFVADLHHIYNFHLSIETVYSADNFSVKLSSQLKLVLIFFLFDKNNTFAQPKLRQLYSESDDKCTSEFIKYQNVTSRP